MHHPSSVSSSCPLARSDLPDPGLKLFADVLLETDVGVLFVRVAPVDQEHVVALVQEVLDERRTRPQVEDVRPIDEGEHQQHRNRMPTIARPIAVQRHLAVRPDDVLGSDPNLRVSLREQDVRELERRERSPRDALERVHDRLPPLRGRRRVPLPLPPPLDDAGRFEPAERRGALVSWSRSTSWRSRSSLSSVRASCRDSRTMS